MQVLRRAVQLTTLKFQELYIQVGKHGFTIMGVAR